MTILAGDVGGTKVTVGWFDPTEADPEGRDAPAPGRRETYTSAEFDGLAAVLQRFLDDLGRDRPARFTAAAFGIAGPVHGDRVETPNLPWIIDGSVLAERFDLPRVELSNDLVATAHGIPALLPDELHELQAGDGEGLDPTRAGALIAAGTGLGTALLAPSWGEWAPLPSEGGHVDFAPRDEWEAGLLRSVQREFPDHVSLERVVSGPGIPRLYRHVVESGAAKPDLSLRTVIEADELMAPAVIGVAGVDGRCPACVEAMERFCSLYGAAAGNLALTGLTTGGVYVGGGIAPKVLPVLQRGGFVEGFLAKGRYRDLLQRIPVQVILQPDAALLGAARRAAALTRA